MSVKERPASEPLVPGRWLYQPASWFEPLAVASMFGRSAPLEVELGSGDGSFLVAWAGRHQERDFLGVERLLGRIRKIDRKAQRAGLTNVRGLRIEAGYCLEYLLPIGGVAALHIYFPDPWPKRRHRRYRLVQERFVFLAQRVLANGGWVHLRTDHGEYFEQMRSVFGSSPLFEEAPTDPQLAAEWTDFEREFRARGVGTHLASYRRRPGPPAVPPPAEEITPKERPNRTDPQTSITGP